MITLAVIGILAAGGNLWRANIGDQTSSNWTVTKLASLGGSAANNVNSCSSRMFPWRLPGGLNRLGRSRISAGFRTSVGLPPATTGISVDLGGKTYETVCLVPTARSHPASSSASVTGCIGIWILKNKLHPSLISFYVHFQQNLTFLKKMTNTNSTP